MSKLTVLQVKEKWNRANYPLLQDRSIIKNILELKKEYQEKYKRRTRLSAQEVAAYLTSLDNIFDISSLTWKEQVQSDNFLRAQEKDDKVTALEDYIGQGATRFISNLWFLFMKLSQECNYFWWEWGAEEKARKSKVGEGARNFEGEGKVGEGEGRRGEKQE